MKQNTAIYYKPDGYDTSGKRLMGRHSAGEGFLKAFVQSEANETLYCHASNQAEFNHFQQLTASWLDKPRSCKLITTREPEKLSQVGNLYIPGPNLPEYAWQRRYHDQRGYSLCGITHTIASKEMIKAISKFITAPIQPWDALICTSSAVKVAVEKILYDWQEYLAQRFNTTLATVPFQLPIIPLGVDKHKFTHNQETRNKLRQQLNIAPEDTVVLFFGRLIFYGKAHPVPMYLALEKAVSQIKSKGKIHLIQCGWFEDKREEKAFQEGAIIFSPSINHIFLDGRSPQVREQIWSAADIFISLADNIQETFGLTPIEAMAANLPVIVSDWNGYKESVRHEIDGFRIPTMIPEPSHNLDIASAYYGDHINYSNFIAHSSLATMVDVDRCTSALVKLIDNPDLRLQMGANGRKRIEEIYDWQNVIHSYRNLWQELREIRNIQAMAVPVTKGSSVNPLCDDPFSLFAHYTSRSLTPHTSLKLTPTATEQYITQIKTNWMTNFGNESRLAPGVIDQIINEFQLQSPLTVNYFIDKYGSQYQSYIMRTLMYLLKFNILEVAEDSQ